ILVVLLVVVFGPALGLPDPNKINLRNTFALPSAANWLGTDENGRDVFARLVAGGRVSLLVGFASAVITVLIASIIGVVAGYLGGAVDQVIMRLTDGFMAIPTFFLLLIVVAIWGSSPTILILSLALTRWMGV